MKPPICTICFRGFRGSISEGGLVQLQLTQSASEYNTRFEKRGFVGHKAGEDWFCRDHYDLAKKYRELTISEAIKKIKAHGSIPTKSIKK